MSLFHILLKLEHKYGEIFWLGTGCGDNLVTSVKNTPMFGIEWTWCYL